MRSGGVVPTLFEGRRPRVRGHRGDAGRAGRMFSRLRRVEEVTGVFRIPPPPRNPGVPKLTYRPPAAL